ncbi:endonuclease-reverse transcriptase [Lasius niger]|uniref:Endonuclease-reverse transcriptase n=1 Tax=Lasius niger TaxID=67767 RepID=A0A0J7MSC0_LASNI|nr:endonuclease-reverse transcriptase [Lasius niger]
MDNYGQNFGNAGQIREEDTKKDLCKISKRRRNLRIRYNHELYQLYKEPPLSTHIKLMRLRWTGHVQRMPETRIVKKVLTKQPGGKRDAGRPRARWGNSVAKDAQKTLGVRNWRRASEDRSGWKRSIEKARA